MAHLEELLYLIEGEKSIMHQREKAAKDYVLYT
jgi:hypothetical protein